MFLITSPIKLNIHLKYNQTTGEYDYTLYSVGSTTVKKDFNYDTDSLRRLNSIDLIIGTNTFKKVIGYDDSKVNPTMGNATNRIYQITYQKNGTTQQVHQYTYDKNHNITAISVKASGTTIEHYQYDYDGFNQLVREDIYLIARVSKTVVYNYDLKNNLTSIKTFSYLNVTGTPQTEKKKYYQNTWKDQLTKIEYYVSGSLSYFQIFSYDASGNVINLIDSRTTTAYKNYEWDGRQLVNYITTSKTIAFKYNDQGIRTQQVQVTSNGTITIDYSLDGDKVLVESRSNGITLSYTYDVDGTLLSMQYNGNEYFYITNMQGDVIELVDINGNTVATYRYDAWGNIIDQTGGTIADINPYRYRGYRYDVETGYYYLQSRYYDPAIGRFIISDGQVNEGVLGENLYIYSENNPIMNIDPEGTKVWHFILGSSLILIGLVTKGNNLIEVAMIAAGTYFIREGHYDRNYLNTDLPEDKLTATNSKWEKDKARYHQFSDSDNVKYLSPDGHKEIIFDIQGKIVDDPRDIGTYNFIPNKVNSVGHGIVDVLPWLLWGNSYQDKTTLLERFKLWAKL